MASAGETARPERIAAQMRRTLALLLRRQVKDPRIGNVTVTDVSVVPDLSVAYVRVLPFGATAATAATGAADSAAAAAMLAGLASAAGYLRGRLARDLSLRRAPRLCFELDEQLERAHHLSKLIDQAVAEDRSHPDGGHGAGSPADRAHAERSRADQGRGKRRARGPGDRH